VASQQFLRPEERPPSAELSCEPCATPVREKRVFVRKMRTGLAAVSRKQHRHRVRATSSTSFPVFFADPEERHQACRQGGARREMRLSVFHPAAATALRSLRVIRYRGNAPRNGSLHAARNAVRAAGPRAGHARRIRYKRDSLRVEPVRSIHASFTFIRLEGAVRETV